MNLGGSLPSGSGNWRNVKEGCNKTSSASSELVCKYDLHSNQECRSMCCDKLEKIKLAYSGRVFQNWGTIFTEGNSSNNGYMCKIDLKDYSVPLHLNSQTFVRFKWKDQLYQFLCLCFGLRPGPRIFTKLFFR